MVIVGWITHIYLYRDLTLFLWITFRFGFSELNENTFATDPTPTDVIVGALSILLLPFHSFLMAELWKSAIIFPKSAKSFARLITVRWLFYSSIYTAPFCEKGKIPPVVFTEEEVKDVINRAKSPKSNDPEGPTHSFTTTLSVINARIICYLFKNHPMRGLF